VGALSGESFDESDSACIAPDLFVVALFVRREPAIAIAFRFQG
jgi:hypothetical protein